MDVLKKIREKLKRKDSEYRKNIMKQYFNIYIYAEHERGYKLYKHVGDDKYECVIKFKSNHKI